MTTMIKSKPLSLKIIGGDSAINRTLCRSRGMIKIPLMVAILILGAGLVLLVYVSNNPGKISSPSNIVLNMKDDNQDIEFIERQTGLDPTHAVIWLHGLGADGHDFEPVVDQFNLPEDISVRFIFPHAPIRPITVNNGMEMRGWFDIVDMDFDMRRSETEDRAGVEHSTEIVKALIEQENQRGIPTEKIILAGFSQGGAIALFAGLRLESRLAGIIGLSTYLPASATTAEELSDANKSTPLFMAHGTQDPIIPIHSATQSYEMLVELGYEIEWHTYDMPHSVSQEEIRHISNFLNQQLKP